MSIATLLTQDVAQLMDDFGSDLTLTRPAAPTYNPATGVLTAGAAANHTIRGVFINYTDGVVDGSVIRAGDRRLLVRAAGAPVTPAVGDIVSGLRVEDVRTVAPNGVPVGWACQMRK
jgi:hypothetical protein